MATEALSGADLKKQISKAKKKPLSFAFVPGKKPDQSVMMLHKKKNPAILGKEAKKEGESNKFAFGTIAIKGKLAELTCGRYYGQLAKQCKMFLRANKVSLNVVILDENGQEIESDIEDLPDDPEMDALAQGDDQDDDQDQADDQVEEQEEEEEEEQFDAAQLAQRLKAVQPAIVAAPAAVGDKLKKVMVIAVGQIKGGDLAKADQTISVLEAAVDKLGNAPAQPQEQEQQASNDGNDKPDTKALIARANALKQEIAGIQGPAREKLIAALTNAAQLIKSGDLGGADTMLGKIEAAVAKTAGTASQQNAASDALPPDAAKWFAAEAKLDPLVEKAMQAKKGDLDGINRAFNYARELAADGAYDRALAAAGKVAQLLKEAAAATTTTAASDAQEAIPDNVVPYVQSRLAWINTRKALLNEMTGLKAAIDTQTAAVEGLEDVPSKSGKLLQFLDDIDSDLEDTLEELVKTPDGDAREALKSQARKIIETYQGVLNTPFFMAVDDSGFATTNIRGSALDSLGKVSAALAS
ncbi:MAG: hypothetical protein KDK24_10430 [Pseudooceanicola sp.]|nr:hypothetical protein [Pseudooceanicola sp.]